MLLDFDVLSHVLLDLVAGEAHRLLLSILYELEDGSLLLVASLAKLLLKFLNILEVLVLHNFRLDVHVHSSKFGVHGLKLVSQGLLLGVLLFESLECDLGLSHG